MDLETGMLTGEELMELTRAKEQETILSAEIAALTDQVEAADPWYERLTAGETVVEKGWR